MGKFLTQTSTFFIPIKQRVFNTISESFFSLEFVKNSQFNIKKCITKIFKFKLMKYSFLTSSKTIST